MLTKEQIEAILDTASGRGLDSAGRMTLPVSVASDICRLALLGLERDARVERIGRAVLTQEGDEEPRDLRNRAASAERYGYESYGALLRTIADAMEDEA